MQKITPIDKPRDFVATEKFFSITDSKGVIQCGNDVFMRVSSYTPEELLFKPHNLIRHPDMPRCVFKLLWSYLEAGREIGAYVKNMAKTGEYYWVYAMVTCLDDGYCSVRIKPSSDIFPIVQELYKELLQHENDYEGNRRDAMASSTELLNKRLNGLGFSDYDDFMCTSLRVEMTLHNKSLKEAGINELTISKGKSSEVKDTSKLKQVFSQLGRLSELSKQIKAKQESFLPLNGNLHSIATNTKFRTARLGEDGRTLSVVSDEIERARLTVSSEIDSLQQDINIVSSAINGAALHSSLCLLQTQIQAEFNLEMSSGNMSEEDQIANYGWLHKDINDALEKSSKESFQRFLKEVDNLVYSLNDFTQFIQFLSRTLQVLDYSYVTGRSLSAPINSAEEFIDILAELKNVARNSSQDLGELRKFVEEARDLVA